jgi:hypothetical protein
MIDALDPGEVEVRFYREVGEQDHATQRDDDRDQPPAAGVEVEPDEDERARDQEEQGHVAPANPPAPLPGTLRLHHAKLGEGNRCKRQGETREGETRS